MAIGFSLQICLPAAIASRLRCSCSCMSVRLTSRSNGAPGEHLVDVRIVVGDLEFLRPLLGPLGNDVARADQLDVRALRQMRQIDARNAAAADDADANALFFLV